MLCGSAMVVSIGSTVPEFGGAMYGQEGVVVTQPLFFPK
jgi:hypothetical protein